MKKYVTSVAVIFLVKKVSSMAAVRTLLLAFNFVTMDNEVLDGGMWKLVWAQIVIISAHCV
jgi:hypothetical protein